MKRAFDIVVSLAALLLLSPVLALAAMAVLVSDGRPIFFRQVRVGRNGRHFRLFKFRSMVKNADKLGGFSTAAEDPRITRVGRFLRRSSIDELPQLLNVLLGDMSIVGPRPDVPAQQANYRPEEWIERHGVRPGLTGLAQAKYRSLATPEQRLSADLEYVQKASLRLDLVIVLMTLRRLTKASN